MNQLLQIIRTDLLASGGGKGSNRGLAIGMIVFCAVAGFVGSPLFGVYCLFLVGAFFTMVLFHNELKFGGERMWCMLPVPRQDVVKARFLLFFASYLAAAALLYLLMLLSMQLRLYALVMNDTVDIIELVVERSGGAFTKFGFFNLCYFTAFALGLAAGSHSLRSYCKNSTAFKAALNVGSYMRLNRRDIGIAIVVIAVFVLALLYFSGILPLNFALAVILQLIVQLAQMANGLLLAVLFVSTAGMSAYYNYIAALLEYDDREF